MPDLELPSTCFKFHLFMNLGSSVNLLGRGFAFICHLSYVYRYRLAFDIQSDVCVGVFRFHGCPVSPTYNPSYNIVYLKGICYNLLQYNTLLLNIALGNLLVNLIRTSPIILST